MSRIFRKTLVAVVLVFGVAANATALLSAWLLHRHLTDEYVTTGRAIAMAIAAASPDALAAGDGASVQSMIDEFLRIDGVGYVLVTNRQGLVVAHTFIPRIPDALSVTPAQGDTVGRVTELHLENLGDFIQVTAPILAGEAGTVAVGMDKAGIWQVMRGAVMRQETLMLAMLVVAVGVFYALIGSITRPLVDLAGYAVKIRDHDFSAKPPSTGDDEVGVLARAMESMASQLSLLVSDLTRAVADTTRELQRSLAHTRAIIDNLADGLLVLDADGRVSLHNPALVTMFDRSRARLQGRLGLELFPPALMALPERSREEGGVATAEVRLAGARTGKAVGTSVRLTGEDREVTIILVRDVTAEKAVDRMKTEFISTVSHELRTPLTSVLGFAKIIRRKFTEVVSPALAGAGSEAWRASRVIREDLDIIVAEGRRLTELINDVLDIAKMESGRCEWTMVPVALGEAATHALRSVGPLAARKGIETVCDIPADLPLVTGDRDRLVQVFVNLLGNAVKFTEKGRIAITGGVVDGEVRVSVRDTGCGIPAGDLERVFKKFSQAGDSMTDKPKGTGLGLPICRQIVERHGGRIWAESRPGQGSVFTFTLPLTARDEAEARAAQAADGREARARARVLVVDGDAGGRRFLEALLVEAGYDVVTAGAGEEALSLARRWRPGCIVMSLPMSDMGGREGIRRLRADPASRDVPVVVVSVISSRERDRPVDQDALLATVRGLLEGRDAASGQPGLRFTGNGGRDGEHRSPPYPGDGATVAGEAALWRALEQGFQGAVFVPAGLEHDVDLERLSAAPGVHVVIVPDRA